MIRNKKGSAWSWIYGLAFLFALGILYTVFLYVFEGHLVPTIKEITNTTLTDEATIQHCTGQNFLDKFDLPSFTRWCPFDTDPKDFKWTKM